MKISPNNLKGKFWFNAYCASLQGYRTNPAFAGWSAERIGECARADADEAIKMMVERARQDEE